MRTVILAGPADIDGFRRQARALALQGVPPEQIEWLTAPDERPLLWTEDPGPDAADEAPPSQPPSPTFSVPASFLDLCNSVLLHREPLRFALMYRLLCRLRADAGLWRDQLDPDRHRAEQMARVVRRDIHKMRAFLRFTPVASPDGERHVAWFEPDHHIVEANASFFVRRFTQMRWAIVTPDCSLAWDLERLTIGPGGDRRDAPAPDAGAALWLTYYRHIFNPARLKVDMMVKEMPRRYWKNLPEAALIEPLIAAAGERAEAMVDAPGTAPRRIKAITRGA